MKRLIASILAAAMLIALAACGSNSENDAQTDADVENQPQEEQGLKVESGEDVVIEGEMLEITPVEPEAEDKAEADKQTGTESGKGNNNKNNNSNKTESSGGGLKVESEGGLKVESGDGIVIEGEKLEVTPVEPEKAPESKPEASAPAASTVGTTLQAAFKAQVSANSSISAQALADALLGNSVIKFSGGTVPVEPGLLTGFDNAEIKGFSEGVMFAPMIGTIPFVGYVFTLESGTDAAGFVSTLKASANPRWNICTAAEETIVDSVGNKVFFVMCPKDMSE